jgi:hypothetical protein
MGMSVRHASDSENGPEVDAGVGLGMRLLAGDRVGWAAGDSDRIGVGVGLTLLAEHAARLRTVRVPTIARLSRRTHLTTPAPLALT